MVDKNTHMSVWSIGRAEKNIMETNILMYNGSSRETTVPCIRGLQSHSQRSSEDIPLIASRKAANNLSRDSKQPTGRPYGHRMTREQIRSRARVLLLVPPPVMMALIRGMMVESIMQINAIILSNAFV